MRKLEIFKKSEEISEKGDLERKKTIINIIVETTNTRMIMVIMVITAITVMMIARNGQTTTIFKKGCKKEELIHKKTLKSASKRME